MNFARKWTVHFWMRVVENRKETDNLPAGKFPAPPGLLPSHSHGLPGNSVQQSHLDHMDMTHLPPPILAPKDIPCFPNSDTNTIYCFPAWRWFKTSPTKGSLAAVFLFFQKIVIDKTSRLSKMTRLQFEKPRCLLQVICITMMGGGGREITSLFLYKSIHFPPASCSPRIYFCHNVTYTSTIAAVARFSFSLFLLLNLTPVSLLFYYSDFWLN